MGASPGLGGVTIPAHTGTALTSSSSSSNTQPEPPAGEHGHPSPHSVLGNEGPALASHTHGGTVTRTQISSHL